MPEPKPRAHVPPIDPRSTTSQVLLDAAAEHTSFKMRPGTRPTEVRIRALEEKVDKLTQTSQTSQTNPYERIAEELWDLLDGIDTLSDIIRPNSLGEYKLLYRLTMEKVSKRHLSLDGRYMPPTPFAKRNALKDMKCEKLQRTETDEYNANPPKGLEK